MHTRHPRQREGDTQTENHPYAIRKVFNSLLFFSLGVAIQIFNPLLLFNAMPIKRHAWRALSGCQLPAMSKKSCFHQLSESDQNIFSSPSLSLLDPICVGTEREERRRRIKFSAQNFIIQCLACAFQIDYWGFGEFFLSIYISLHSQWGKSLHRSYNIPMNHSFA